MGIIEKMRLDGKKGFVTGAARGIGKCTATAFAEAGADVAIVDMDIETAKATAQEIAQATAESRWEELWGATHPGFQLRRYEQPRSKPSQRI